MKKNSKVSHIWLEFIKNANLGYLPFTIEIYQNNLTALGKILLLKFDSHEYVAYLNNTTLICYGQW